LLVEHLWPFAASERVAFITWLYNFDTSDFDDWLLAGDFNLIRSSANRNKEGGNQQDMLLFNDLSSIMIWLKLSSGAKTLLGVTCNRTPSLKNWIGFSLPPLGLPHTLTLLLRC
jgi:hypothetical protein